MDKEQYIVEGALQLGLTKCFESELEVLKKLKLCEQCQFENKVFYTLLSWLVDLIRETNVPSVNR